MNPFIYFPANKDTFRCLVFPETFAEEKEDFKTLLNSISKRFVLGILNTEDITIEKAEQNPIITETKVPRVNATDSSFPSHFDKNIEYAHGKAREYLNRENIDNKELWEKVYWASMYKDEYGDGNFDFIVVGDKWINSFNELPQYNTISFSDLITMIRSVHSVHRNYQLNAVENRPIRYDFYYSLHSFIYFYNFLMLFGIGHEDRLSEKYSDRRLRDIHEALISLGNRLRNIIMSYDEANYELFLPTYSTRSDYRVSSFYSECMSVTEDIARLIMTLYTDLDRAEVFAMPINLYCNKMRAIIKTAGPALQSLYNNPETMWNYDVLRVIRNKLRHGDAAVIDDWKVENGKLRQPQLRLFHLDRDEVILSEFAESRGLTLSPFWWSEQEMKLGDEAVGHRLALRETLDFSFNTVVELVNSFADAITSDLIRSVSGLNKYRGKRKISWVLLKNFCNRKYPNFFNNRPPSIFFNYSRIKHGTI